jgi:hypothetical protein
MYAQRTLADYMKPKDIGKALLIVKEHQTEFERRWDEYFN